MSDDYESKMKNIREMDPSFDMAYKLGALQAKAEWAMKYLRIGADNCSNKYIKKMLLEEATKLREFLINECGHDIPFDAKYD